MASDHPEHNAGTTRRQGSRQTLEEALPRLRATLALLSEVRIAFFQPGPVEDQLALVGPDCPRVILGFTRKVSSEHVAKRIERVRRRFLLETKDYVEFLDIDQMPCREACETAFNAQVLYGGIETVERERLARYNQFLEWNAGKRLAGDKQDAPPAFTPSIERLSQVVSVDQFITPIYRHLKMIEGHLRELRRIVTMESRDFEADPTLKPLTESYIVKSIQSAILITMSVMHRKMRLAARDYRDLFLSMSVYGLTTRERAARLAKCADLRDRMMFQYEEIDTAELRRNAEIVLDAMTEYRSYMLEWLFEHYYAPTGELIQHE